MHLETESCIVVGPVIALPLPVGRDLPGPVEESRGEAVPQVLVAAGVCHHFIELTLTTRADGLVVSIESEKPRRGFGGLNDREQLTFIGCAVISPVRRYETTKDEGRLASGRNLDNRPTGGPELLLGGVSGTAIGEEKTLGGGANSVIV
eukprot:1359943-Amphidinium_carterae.2